MMDNMTDAPGAADSSLPAESNLKEYLEELRDIDMSEEQKMELLGVIYSIMLSFVQLGFDVGSADIWGSISGEALDPPSEMEDSGTTIVTEETSHG